MSHPLDVALRNHVRIGRAQGLTYAAERLDLLARLADAGLGISADTLRIWAVSMQDAASVWQSAIEEIKEGGE
jgi:hypothetical protein